MNTRAESVRIARPLFQAEGSGETPTSALQLFFGPVPFATARQLNLLWHSRLPAFTAPQCRIAYAAEFDGLFYATAIWSRPKSRHLPQYAWMELSRLAIAPDAPRNTASRMLGWMAKDIARRFPEIEQLISYQDTEVHTGSIYRAVGWKVGFVGTPTKGKGWQSSRPWVNKAQSNAAKIRWELILRAEEAKP